MSYWGNAENDYETVDAESKLSRFGFMNNDQDGDEDEDDEAEAERKLARFGFGFVQSEPAIPKKVVQIDNKPKALASKKPEYSTPQQKQTQPRQQQQSHRQEEPINKPTKVQFNQAQSFTSTHDQPSLKNHRVDEVGSKTIEKNHSEPIRGKIKSKKESKISKLSTATSSEEDINDLSNSSISLARLAIESEETESQNHQKSKIIAKDGSLIQKVLTKSADMLSQKLTKLEKTGGSSIELARIENDEDEPKKSKGKSKGKHLKKNEELGSSDWSGSSIELAKLANELDDKQHHSNKKPTKISNAPVADIYELARTGSSIALAKLSEAESKSSKSYDILKTKIEKNSGNGGMERTNSSIQLAKQANEDHDTIHETTSVASFGNVLNSESSVSEDGNGGNGENRKSKKQNKTIRFHDAKQEMLDNIGTFGGVGSSKYLSEYFNSNNSNDGSIDIEPEYEMGPEFPDEMSAFDFMKAIGRESDWSSQEIIADSKVLASNRLKSVKQLRQVSELGWEKIDGLLPVVKDRIMSRLL